MDIKSLLLNRRILLTLGGVLVVAIVMAAVYLPGTMFQGQLISGSLPIQLSSSDMLVPVEITTTEESDQVSSTLITSLQAEENEKPLPEFFPVEERTDSIQPELNSLTCKAVSLAADGSFRAGSRISWEAELTTTTNQRFDYMWTERSDENYLLFNDAQTVQAVYPQAGEYFVSVEATPVIATSMLSLTNNYPQTLSNSCNVMILPAIIQIPIGYKFSEADSQSAEDLSDNTNTESVFPSATEPSEQSQSTETETVVPQITTTQEQPQSAVVPLIPTVPIIPQIPVIQPEADTPQIPEIQPKADTPQIPEIQPKADTPQMPEIQPKADTPQIPVIQPEADTTQSISIQKEENTATSVGDVSTITASLSKCEVAYPTDIEGHWAEKYIKQGYDDCLFKGIEEKFHPDWEIYRIEAASMLLLSLGIQPETGCYNFGCGTPFLDLTAIEEGSIIRPLYLKGLIEGYGRTIFKPRGFLTRAEASAMIVKAFFEPHKGCYTPNCGSGHPNSFFNDINDMWQGQYIRVLWDKGILTGSSTSKVEPNNFITRAEMAKMIVMAHEQTK